MDDNKDKILKLSVKFEESQEEIQLKEPISLNELSNKIAEQFKIPKDKVKNLGICYFDEEDDIVPLEEKDNLFEISTKDSDNIYILNLEVELFEDNLIESIRNMKSYKNIKSLKSMRSIRNINIKNFEPKIDNNKNNIENKENKDNKENKENKNDNNELENKLLKKKEENEKLKNTINEMNKLKIEELTKKISEIKDKNNKRNLLKQKKEKKLIELKNAHREKIENLKKEIEILKFNKYLNEMKNIIEEKINDLNKNNEEVEKMLNDEKQNILKTLEEKILEKKKEVIKMHEDYIKENNKTFNKEFEKMEKDIENINDALSKSKLFNNLKDVNDSNISDNNKILQMKIYKNNDKVEITINNKNPADSKKNNNNIKIQESENRGNEQSNTKQNQVEKIKNEFKAFLDINVFNNINVINKETMRIYYTKLKNFGLQPKYELDSFFTEKMGNLHISINNKNILRENINKIREFFKKFDQQRVNDNIIS